MQPGSAASNTSILLGSAAALAALAILAAPKPARHDAGGSRPAAASPVHSTSRDLDFRGRAVRRPGVLP